MAHFYGDLTGSRGTATRCGTRESGIEAHPRGWDLGVKVRGEVADDEDVFVIYATGGSHGSTPSRYLGRVELHDGEPVFVPALRGVSDG